ncbi:MAG: hypothetical protein II859_10365 [Bacteroidales bacterium]|nr:hypothetical protein [Bacteroidales bacterium]
MRHLNDQYFSGNQLKEVAEPSVATDAATKGYVDGIVEGLVSPGVTFYGYTDTPAATANKVVTLIAPTDGFANGSKLLLHFNNAVPAGNSNIITVAGNQYMLAYHQAAITTAGIINAGDKALIVCFNSVAHVVAIDRWGVDMSAAQGTLPALAGNAGRVLAVNNGETGVEWVPMGGSGASQLAVTDDDNGNIGLSLTGGSQSLSVVDDNNGNITLTLN